MRKFTALGALVLVGFLGVAAAAPSADVDMPLPAITQLSHADAAIGRGGGAGEGGSTQVGKKTASWLQEQAGPIFFIAVAFVLAGVSLKRDAGAAVAILIAAVVIGAFLLVPDRVEVLYRSIYNTVL